MNPTHVGFTGSSRLIRNQTDRLIELRGLITGLCAVGPTMFHHGDCVGMDALLHEAVTKHRDSLDREDILIRVHPPMNPKFRAYCFASTPGREYTEAEPRKYIERNHVIVDAANLLIAMPRDVEVEERRSGTWATIRYARKQGKPVYVL